MDTFKISIVAVAIVAMVTEVSGGSTRRHRPQCITSCRGKAAGHYASCLGCEFYATCAHGQMYDRQECQDGTLWDDVKKTCDFAFYVTCADGSARPPDAPMAEPGMGQDTNDNSGTADPSPSPSSDPDSNEAGGYSTKQSPSSNLKSLPDPTSDNSAGQTDFDTCLIWIVLCLIAVGLLFCLSIYHFVYVRFGYLCKKNPKMVDAYTQIPAPSITSSAPAYDDVMGSDSSERYVPLPYSPGSDSNPIYQEIFPIYEELSQYRDRYLTLNGYTYLQLVDHVGNDVIRREIARSVGPLYLTLCHQHETSPKAYESTQDRMRALVHDVWQEMSPVHVENLPKPKKNK